MIVLIYGSVIFSRTGEDEGDPDGQPGDAALHESLEDAPDWAPAH